MTGAAAPPPPLPPLFSLLWERRRLLLVLTGVVALGALLATPGVGLNFTPQRVLESNDDSFAFLERCRRAFGHDDGLAVVHVASDDLFRPERLDYLRRLHDAIGAVKGIEGVDDLTSAWVHPPGALLPQPLFTTRGPALAPALARRLALAEPLLAGRLISQDGGSALLVARVTPGLSRYEDLSPLVHALRAALDAIPPPEGVSVRLTGIPVARVFIVERLLEDQLVYFPVCAVLFLAVLLFLFRDLLSAAVPLLAVLLALVLTVGLMGLLGEDVDIINNVLPVLIFVIGTSDAIHIVGRYRRELAAGLAQREALGRTVQHLTVACLLTSATTAAGFASLAVAEFDILRHFGLLAAGGVMLAYLATIVFVPLAFSYLPARLGAAAQAVDRGSDRFSEALGRWVIRHHRAVLAGAGLVVLVAAWFAAGVHEENHLYETFPSDDPVVAANARIERDFAGVLPVALVFEWDPQTDPLRPEALALVEELERELDAQPDLGNALSVVDLLAEWNRSTHLGDPAWRRLPDRPELLAEGLAALQAALAAQGREQLLGRIWAPEARMLRVTAQTGDRGATALEASLQPVRARLEQLRPRLEAAGLRARISGDGPVASAGINRLISDLFHSLLLAFAFILGTLWLLLRSLRAALVCMVPNLVPLLLTLGFMGAVGMDLRVTSVIVFTVSLGLAVDDTIHFMARFREEWHRPPLPGEHGDPYARAILRTYRGTGSAIAATSFLLAGGFSVLLLSRFPVTRTFALCLEVTVCTALLGDLLLLPALLLVLRPFRSEGGQDAATARPDPSAPGALQGQGLAAG